MPKSIKHMAKSRMEQLERASDPDYDVRPAKPEPAVPVVTPSVPGVAPRVIILQPPSEKGKAMEAEIRKETEERRKRNQLEKERRLAQQPSGVKLKDKVEDRETKRFSYSDQD